MLTPRQQLFVSSYAVHHCATRAATEAGYSPRSAHAQGHRLLKNAEVRTAVETRHKLVTEKLEINQEAVLQELARLAFGEVRDSAKVRALELLGRRLGLFEPNKEANQNNRNLEREKQMERILESLRRRKDTDATNE